MASKPLPFTIDALAATDSTSLSSQSSRANSPTSHYSGTSSPRGRAQRREPNSRSCSPRSRSRSASRSPASSPACSELSPGGAPSSRTPPPLRPQPAAPSEQPVACAEPSRIADAMNVINAAMAKAAGGESPPGSGQAAYSANGHFSKHACLASEPSLSQSSGQQQQQKEQQEAMAAAMAATNSFLYAGLSPAAAALLPRLYAANSFLATQPAAPSSAAAAAAAAGLLATVPQLGRPQVGPPPTIPGEAANFMLAADPSLWAALGAGGFGSHLGSGGTGSGAHAGELLAQTAQLMAQQQQQQQQGGRNMDPSAAV